MFKSTSLLSILLETCSCILEVAKPLPPVLKYTEFDFPLICDDLRELFSLDLKEKNLAFEVEYTCNQWIRSEPIRLRQILINLISNAIKYSQMGGKVSLKVSKCCDILSPCRLHAKKINISEMKNPKEEPDNSIIHIQV